MTEPADTGWRPPQDPGSGWVPPPAGTPPAPPQCYRHPGRETYVTCQRCGRPICPDCMRPAAVGFHCPEESGERRSGSASSGPGSSGSADSGRSRQARTVLGGRVGVGRPGLVTQILVGICVVVYILQQGSGSILRDYSLLGDRIAFGDEYYRLLTAAFLHLSLIHVLFNVLALYLLGTQLEQMLGRVRYVAVFVVSAGGGNATSYLVNGADASSAGASTAVYGFFAAYFMIARRLRADTSQILVIVGINLVITFALPGIDRWGHLGGLAAGIALGAIFSYIPPRLAAVQAAAVTAVLAAFLGAAVLESHAITKDAATVSVASATVPVASATVPVVSAVVEPVAFHDLGDPVRVGAELSTAE